MANRFNQMKMNTFQKEVFKIQSVVSFGAAGAPTLVSSGFVNQGIVSVTRDNTGLYTFVFGTQAGMLDVYYKLLGASVVFDTSGAAGAAPAAPLMAILNNLVATPASCSIQIQLYDADTPAATDPASGEIGYFEFTLKNSTAP